MNLAELRMAAAQLDTAEIRDVRVGDNPYPEKRFRAVFNTDKQRTSAIVSDQYQLIQHRDVVESVCDALQNLNLRAKSRVRNQGDVVYVDVEFPERIITAQVGEEFVLGFRLLNSYNKQTGIIVMPRIVRLACKNGMVVPVGWVKGFAVAHTSAIAGEFDKAIPAMIREMTERDARLRQIVEENIADSVEWEAMRQITYALLKVKKHRDAILGILKEHTNNPRPSRWDLYNAITSYATHGQQVSPWLEASLQRKAQKVLLTSTEKLPKLEDYQEVLV
jgi:hypothetical protein